MILACALVAASGAIRLDQERRFAVAARDAETPPFPMRNLPRTLGEHWEMVGGEIELEEETIAIAGCADYMHRRYKDNRTGVTVTVLVSYGPALRVFPHSPMVCFPANGYEHRGGPWRRDVSVDGAGAGASVPFNAAAYGKAVGGIDELREVYYTFWHDGRWSPVAEGTDHLFQHRPAMFKVQVERPIIAGEVGSSGGPAEEFLAALIPEIERRLAVEGQGDDQAGDVAEE